MTLTDDEYVARVEGAAASLRARNAAWLEAINHIKVPAVHEAVTARFDSNGTLVEFDIIPRRCRTTPTPSSNRSSPTCCAIPTRRCTRR